MEIDDDGNLHIGYTTQSSSWNITTLTNINGSWQSTNVLPSFHNYGIANDGYSLAVGGDGSLHFTYLAVPNGGGSNCFVPLIKVGPGKQCAEAAAAS